MRKIETCFTPELIHLYDLKEKMVIVVDILRATSTMVTALAHGIKRILPVSSLKECMAYKKAGYLVAAERDGQKAAGFDLGNSPFSYMNNFPEGTSVAISTTNGTLAITRSLEADQILIGSFLNIQSLADHIESCDKDILIVCAGWKGKVNMEDTLFAGALINLLKKTHNTDCDSSLLATSVFHQAAGDMLAVVKCSSHANRLTNLDSKKDIAFCLEWNKYNVIPVLKDGHLEAY